MASVRDYECDCWRFTRLLLDEPLPDHACEATMRATVTRELQTTLDTLGQTFIRLATPEPGASPAPIAFPASLDPQALRRIESEYGDIWPLPWRNQRLALVIRQWAQDDPSIRLARQFKADRRWQSLVREEADRYGLFKRSRPDIDEDAWLNVEIPRAEWPRDRWLLLDSAGFAFTAEKLRLAGFPSTPATVKHLRAVVVGRMEPLPCRGVLVTSFVLARNVRQEGSGFFDPVPITEMTALLPWTTGPLLAGAQRVALRHRDWAARQAPHPLTELSAVRKAQPGSFQGTAADGELDYLAEALRDAPLWAQTVRARRGQHFGTAITQRLNESYRRVSQRRRRRGLDVEPPDGWRGEARRQLQALFT